MRKIWAFIMHQKVLLLVEPWGIIMQWEHPPLKCHIFFCLKYTKYLCHYEMRSLWMNDTNDHNVRVQTNTVRKTSSAC